MSEKVKVKISIADRVYPLYINPEEEAGIRKIATKIESLILDFEKKYAVKDKQDVLAMCTLQFASQLEKSNTESESLNDSVFDKLNELNTLINQVI